MAIQIDAEKKIFTLETDHTMYQMQADAYGVLRHLWYGAKTGCDMSYLQDYPDVGFPETSMRQETTAPIRWIRCRWNMPEQA